MPANTAERSREVIEDARIVRKINLTTGPMAITGSTRMQATTIQLCVMLTVLEMVMGICPVGSELSIVMRRPSQKNFLRSWWKCTGC